MVDAAGTVEGPCTDLFDDPDPGIQAQILDLKARFAAWWNNESGHAPQYAPTGGQNLAPRQHLRRLRPKSTKRSCRPIRQNGMIIHVLAPSLGTTPC